MLKSLFQKYGRGKIYLISALILIIINIITMVIAYQVKTSFSIGGIHFQYISRTDKEILFADSEGNKATVTIDEKSYEKSSHFTVASRYQIEYNGKVIKCDSTDWMEKGEEIITLFDGTMYAHPLLSMGTSNYNVQDNLPFEMQLVRYINNVYKYVKEGNRFWMLIFTIPLILFGLWGLVYPEKVWRLQHWLTVSGGEPTDFALSANKFMGIFFIAIALLCPVFVR